MPVPTPWTARFVDTEAGLAALAPAWQALWVADGQADAFAHPAWFMHWWRHFGQGAQRAALVANTGAEWVPLPGQGWRLQLLVLEERTGAGQPAALRAVLPLVGLQASFRGTAGQLLATPVNSQALRSGLCAPDFNSEMADVMARHLLADGRWQLLLLDGLPLADGRLALLQAALAPAALQPLSQAGWTHSRLAITQAWAPMLEAHARNFRKHLFQSERCLARLGPLSIECLPTPGEAGFALIEAIESRSWKAQGGEVVAGDPRLRGYYAGLCGLQAGALRSELWLLRIGGEPAAYFLCLRDGRMLYTLKTSFDQRFAPSSRHSPSQVLLARLIEACWNDGLQAIDFVGELPWVARWADHHPGFSHGLWRRPALVRWRQVVRRLWPGPAVVEPS